MEIELLQWLEEWYRAQCDGSWEHLFGVSVETLDNPGWHVEIDIEDTNLMNKDFNEIWYDKGAEDWLICRINQGKFEGSGDPKKLLSILQIFKDWVEA